MSLSKDSLEMEAPSNRRPAIIAAGSLATVFVLALLAVFALGGQYNFEKTLKALVAPVGLLWLGLLGQVVFFSLAGRVLAATFNFGLWVLLTLSGNQLVAPVGLLWLGLLGQVVFFSLAGRVLAATFNFGLWVLLTLSGNQLVARWVDWRLEHTFLETRVSSLGKFDAVLILGGSTSMTPAGDFQGGSRVFAGLRLFRAGQVKTLLVSGEQNSRSSPQDLNPGQEAKQMLLQSGVPESAIVVLGGLNTSEEIKALDEWLETNASNDFRVGILSDASHLVRALSLCNTRGIEATGIPSSFDTNPFVPNPSLVIPSSANLSKTQNFAFEVLGRLVGR